MTEPARNVPLTAEEWPPGDWLTFKDMRSGTIGNYSKGEVVRLVSESGGVTVLIGPHGEDAWPSDYLAFLARPADPNDPEGWVATDGNGDPAPETKKDVVLRSGEIVRNYRGQTHYWQHDGDLQDIAHWRPHTPAPAGEGEKPAFDQRAWDFEAMTKIAAHLRDNPADPYSGHQCEEFVLDARDRLYTPTPPSNGYAEGCGATIADKLDVAGLADILARRTDDDDAKEAASVLRTLLSALSASQEREARPREALEKIAHPPYGLGFNKLRGIARAALQSLKEPRS